MAQKFSLYGLLSVRQNLEFSAGVYGLEGNTRRERIEEMIETFDLGDWLSSPRPIPCRWATSSAWHWPAR
jgi:ABC-2 type transport system ATP-binding protein